MDKVLQHLSEVLLGMRDSAISTIPKIIGFLTILILGWIIAKLVARFISGLFLALQSEKLDDTLRDVDFFSKLNIKSNQVVAKIFYWLILLVFLNFGAELLNIQTIKDGLGSVFAYIPKLISGGIFFIIGMIIANVIKNVLLATTKALNIPTGSFISNFIFYFLVIIIAISALKQLGINTDIISTNLTLAMGAIFFAFAIGYGLAAKNVVGNFLSSLHTKDRFVLGEHIKVDGLEGKIIKIGTTTITLDAKDRNIIIPQSKLVNATIEVLKNRIV